MLWWLIPVLTLVFILSFLLLTPFYIELDSRSGLFRFRIQRIANAIIYIAESSLFIDLKIAWWQKKIDLFAPRKKVALKKEKKIKRRTHKIPVKKIWSVIKSFKINKCILNIDTGNMPLNGILYPLFAWLENRTEKPVAINFKGENVMVFETENNLARMLWAYIKS